MRFQLIVAAAAILSAPVHTWADTDPLAPAKAGMLGCCKPNKELKTCTVLFRLEWGADGTVIDFTEFLASAAPVVIGKAKIQARATKDGLCYHTQESEIQAIEYYTANGPLPELDSKIFRNHSMSLASESLNKETCEHFSNDGDYFDVTYVIDGGPRKKYPEKSIWVRPGDGYTVAP